MKITHAHARLFLLLASSALLAQITVEPVLAANERVRKNASSAMQRPDRIVKKDHWSVLLDLRSQKLHLDAEDPEYCFRKDALARVIPPIRNGFEPGHFVSASMMVLKAKQFDDGVYAAVELAAQSGLGKISSKRELLRSIATELNKQKTSSDVAPTILAAAQLGKINVSPNSSISGAVTKKLTEFNSRPEQSKPIGFYTWTDQLEQIFLQDRMLQSELKGASGIASLTRLLNKNKERSAAYRNYLSLVNGLSNPFREKSLFDKPTSANEGLYFFPPTESPEFNLLKRRFGGKPVPEDFDVFDELISDIEKGKLSLRPKPNSGWYDYQCWALEPLVKPGGTAEAKKLEFGLGYRQQLRELFRCGLALSRETQIKNLACGSGSGCGGYCYKIEVCPELSVEPLGTMYYRRAVGYNFLRKVLARSFGEDTLNKMHRKKENGESKLGLGEELRQMETLFAGAYRQSANEIGLPLQSLQKIDGRPILESAAAAFRQWSAKATQDPDLQVDARMMVPVFYDPEKKRTKVWAFLGWQENYLHATFSKNPDIIEIRNAKRNPMEPLPAVEFCGSGYPAYYPVVQEFYTEKILNRKEFRALCDRNKNSPQDILQELEPPKPPLPPGVMEVAPSY